MVQGYEEPYTCCAEIWPPAERRCSKVSARYSCSSESAQSISYAILSPERILGFQAFPNLIGSHTIPRPSYVSSSLPCRGEVLQVLNKTRRQAVQPIR